MPKQKFPKRSKINLSGVVISGNSESVIKECLESMKFCDELILVDTGITDNTAEIAKKYGARIVSCKTGSFDSWRNCGLENARGEWLLYLDSDERVTPDLEKEIVEISLGLSLSLGEELNCYAIPRNNYILGRRFKHSGEFPDYQKRFFRRLALHKWIGVLHEEPEFEGVLGYLKSPMIHIKHDNFYDMIRKTNKWSEKEAKLLYNTNHPQMVPWRFFRIMFTEGFDKFIKKKAFLDGYEGVMYGVYQIWSRVLTYAKLWEMQNLKS